MRRLHEFQDCVRHLEHWAGDVGNALPIEQLLPKGTDPSPANWFQVSQLIEQKINRLIPVVSHALLRTGINTRIRLRIHAYPQDEWREHDLVQDYSGHIPGEAHQERYGRLMRCLENGIGLYEERLSAAKRESVNPLHWFALVVRLPITIMEMAGIITTDEEHSQFIRIYVWLVKLVMLSLLILGATKLGISIPWDDVLRAIK